MKKDIRVIVVSGGPAGGKDGAMNDHRLRKMLAAYGIEAYCIAETATEFFAAGFHPAANLNLSPYNFQEQMFYAQLEKENRYIKAAARTDHPNPVVILNRGIMDIAAYMSNKDFLRMIKGAGLTVPEIRDGRYDAVGYLLSPGVDDPELYRKVMTTNPHRVEKTPEDAAAADKRTLSAWVGHPHLRVIDNSTDFEGKKDRLVKMICHVLGVPEPLEIERKFLLPRGLNIPGTLRRSGVLWASVDIEQAYLKSDSGLGRRIRCRGQHGSYTYELTRKKEHSPGVRIEMPPVRITADQYQQMAKRDRIPDRDVIKKTRYCFLWEHQYFELDVVREPVRHAGLTLLELELNDVNDHFSLPPFFKNMRDVTLEKKYGMKSLASRKMR